MEIVVEPSPEAPQSQHTILISLFSQKAPLSSRNFLNYVEDHFYDGTIFHRMIPHFMIQGGGFSPGMKVKQGRSPISNEASNNRQNTEGTIAMARTMEIDSATSQFFINLQDNPFLNHRDDTNQGYGYAVFGQIVSGLDWLEKLQELPTHQVHSYADVPLRQVIIKRARVLSGKEKQQALVSLAETQGTHSKANH